MEFISFSKSMDRYAHIVTKEAHPQKGLVGIEAFALDPASYCGDKVEEGVSPNPRQEVTCSPRFELALHNKGTNTRQIS